MSLAGPYLRQFFLGLNDSYIYPNMCAKFGRDPTVVSGGKKGIQAHKGAPQLYIVLKCITSDVIA